MNEVNNLIKGDNFDIKFSSFLTGDQTFRKNINEQRFTIKDEAISSRVLNHWHSLGLLVDDRPNKKGWRKFSISEMIWMRIMIELRKFDLSLTKIKRIKETLDQLNQKKLKESKCLQLDYFIAHTIMESTPIKLLVFSNGETVIGTQNEIDTALKYDFIKDNYISIDINQIVKKFSPNVKDVDYFDYNLTRIEKAAKEELFKENIKSITIKTTNDEYFLIETEEIIDCKKELNEFINSIDYGSTTISKRGRKTLLSKKAQKKIKK